MGSLAQYPIQEIAAAIVFIAVGILSALGYTKGTDKKTDSKDTVIAGGIVDNQAIYKLASSIDEHNLIATKQLATMQTIGENLGAACKSIERACNSMDKMSDRIQDAATDLIRNNNRSR